jgi:hypothetical protein
VLPNLPALAGLSDYSVTPYTINAVEWTLIAKADPERWAIGFSTGQFSGALIAPFKDDTFDMGFIVDAGNFPTWKYQDWLTMVQGEWWGFSKGTNTVYVWEVWETMPGE